MMVVPGQVVTLTTTVTNTGSTPLAAVDVVLQLPAGLTARAGQAASGRVRPNVVAHRFSGAGCDCRVDGNGRGGGHGARGHGARCACAGCRPERHGQFGAAAGGAAAWAGQGQRLGSGGRGGMWVIWGR
ncbi:MAG: hypothetical protein HZY76_01230 [Anaerolineae bacterium]|nr:MAG: hypothetical protein HZY76_01230 [Anaerolineae bacterium]